VECLKDWGHVVRFSGSRCQPCDSILNFFVACNKRQLACNKRPHQEIQIKTSPLFTQSYTVQIVSTRTVYINQSVYIVMV
jgi:hypothetical protein